MSVIYDNKENLPFIPDLNIEGQSTSGRAFGNLISSNNNNHKTNSMEKKIGFSINLNKISPDRNHNSNKAKSTAILNRTMNGQFCSKST